MSFRVFQARWAVAAVFLPLAAALADDATNAVMPPSESPPEIAPAETVVVPPSNRPSLRLPKTSRETLELVDEFHDQISSNIVSYVGRVDRFFGDKQVQEENRRNYVQAGVGIKWKEHEGVSFENDVNVRMNLPRLEDRLQLVVDTAVERMDVDRVNNVVDAFSDPEAEASLRYIFLDALHYRVHLDAGLDTSPLDPFLRFRGNLKFPSGDDLLQLRETVKVSVDDGLQETTTVQWDDRLSARWVFRSASSVTWEESTNGVSPQQTFQLFGKMDEKSAVKLEAGGIWPATPHAEQIDYWIGTSYRRRIFRDWLFAEITPRMDFPQVRGYEAVPSIAFMFSGLFGDWGARPR